MKNFRFFLIYSKLLFVLIFAAVVNSCKDTDYLEKNQPPWLGESIYDQLEKGYTEENGTVHTFKTFVKLIDEVKTSNGGSYGDILRVTGSKTLFVADDEAFKRFYQSNEWGVTSYEQFTPSQKKLLLNSSMINNAYLIELMSNTSSSSGPVEGQALRRATALSVIDTVILEKSGNIPENNKNWDYYRNKGIYLVKGSTPYPILHFLQKYIDYKNITDDDLTLIFNNQSRQRNDAYIYDAKIIVRDITCKNGYLNILEKVLLPVPNMAEKIRTQPETKYFASMLERFSCPYYNSEATRLYKSLNPNFTDSIFTKRYFAEISSTSSTSSSGSTTSDIVNAKGVKQIGYLNYDPGWNTYSMPSDMGVIFAPTKKAFDDYFQNDGKFLVEKYNTPDSIPMDVLSDLVKNHLKISFLNSLPHNFGQVVNDAKQSMGIDKSDWVKTYLANNGVVYVMNKVYPPAKFKAVTGPLVVNDNTRIFNRVIKIDPGGVSTISYGRGFEAYLLSMESYYSLIVPMDITPLADKYPRGMYYVNPVAYAKKQPEVIRFNFNKAANSIKAKAFKYDIATGTIGDSLSRNVSVAEITNLFDDILDYHVVVDNIESGKSYYRTKGGGSIKVDNSGGKMRVLGGGNIENPNFTPNVTKDYTQKNGKTYLIDSPLLPPFRSVYKIMHDNPEFSEFFNLLNYTDPTWTNQEVKKYAFFYRDGSDIKVDPNPKSTMDYYVRFFNTYHYTVYIPTNNAVQKAIADGLPTWDVIKNETTQTKKDSLTNILVNFLRYHFQDNSIYINGVSAPSNSYETAAYTEVGQKAYFKLDAKLDNNDLTLNASSKNPAKVLKSNGLYNIMARDYKFDAADLENSRMIYTSSWAVIHQIDNYLLYKPDALKKAKQLMNRRKK